MKKNTKIISLTAAALLAVAPVIGSTIPVNAADTINLGVSSAASTTPSTSSSSTTTQAPADRPYFTYDNNVIGEATTANPTGNVVRTTISLKYGENIDDLINAITSKLKFYPVNNSAPQDVKIDKTAFINQLTANKVTTATFYTDKNKNLTTDKSKAANPKKSYTGIATLPSSAFNLTLSATGNNNQTATIQIPMVPENATTSTDTSADPVIKWSEGGNAQSTSLNGQVFQVAVGSNFDPLNFVNSNGETISISAQQTKDNPTYASIAATTNSVNTSEAGRYYNVTLTATGITGKKTTVTYTVLITSSEKQTLYANGASAITTYSIYGNNVMSNATTFKDGDQVYVSDATKTINGVSYSQVSPKSKSDANSSNIWVLTSSLVKPAGDTNVKTLPVMVDSRAYDKNGSYLGHMYYAYNNIDIVPTVVTINGKTYYKVANKDEYVRVTNITGNQRTLTRNAYIYWSSYRRTPGTGLMLKGQTVTTYGGQMRFKNGKKYYRIDGCRDNNKRYIKAVNFS